MNDSINVIVVDRGRKNLYLRYTDPVTGQKVEKSASTASKREAVKAAGQWESELRAGTGRSGRALRWEAFRDAYQDHVDATLSKKTSEVTLTTFNVIERVMKPDSVRRITAQWITRFQNDLLKAGRSAATVESYCRHLKAALNWAHGQGLLASVPKFNRLKKARSAKMMKGRAVTLEEFERMLQAVTDHLPERQHESMKFLLRGLWLSGLRLGEALTLTWDQWADGIRVDTSGQYVMLLIPAESEKGGQDRVYPVTPDFAEFLRSVPEADRQGFVFNVELYRGICRRLDTVSKAIVRVGQLAGIKVDQKSVKNPKTGKPEPQAVYASAHDLRRAFGFRWSRRVTSMVLKELMRHASVTTTETYYVNIDADSTAALLAELVASETETSGLGDTLGDTNEKRVSAER